jgi:hypothetical protein
MMNKPPYWDVTYQGLNKSLKKKMVAATHHHRRTMSTATAKRRLKQLNVELHILRLKIEAQMVKLESEEYINDKKKFDDLYIACQTNIGLMEFARSRMTKLASINTKSPKKKKKKKGHPPKAS